MATKKPAKATRTKATSVKRVTSKHPSSPFHPLYGRPILDAVKSGNVSRMKQIRSVAQRHVKEVNAALAKLEARLNKG
jgi:hypothetical protein